MLADHRIQRHRTSSQEIGDLLKPAERGLADAGVSGISTDLRFSAAYEAALALATIPLHCAGYRTRGAGHHATAFEALPLAMGEGARSRAELFDTCRAKRNVAQYRRAGEITCAEVEALMQAVAVFRTEIEQWLETHHPEFMVER